MLELLRIQNYALIEDLEVEFQPGFNVLTGETGAGKSIIIGALNLVLGSRASSEIVREGAEKAKIEAVFRIIKPSKRLKALLEEFGVEVDQGELLLSRTITADARSRAFACGTMLPLNQLAQIGDELVDLHGQHDHQSLLQTERQMELVDSFAGAEKDAALTAELVMALRDIDKKISGLEADDRDRARRVEFLKFEVSEINSAGLQSGEEEELRTRRNLITNAERVFTLATTAYNALYEGESETAIDQLDTALAAIADLQRIDPQFDPIAEILNGIRAGLESASAELRAYTEAVEYDANELDTLNLRLTKLSDLKRKFGESVDAILAYRDKAQLEIEQFEQRDEVLSKLRSERLRIESDANAAAAGLSKKRKAAAQRLDKKVTIALQDLGMKGATFCTRIDVIPLQKSGIDHVEFLLAANQGERPKPLRQVASGGEISRVMLAIKTVLASDDKIPTLIFDEIDSGVGGAVAVRIAARLGELAATHQTICITHLPQIAAAAQHHFIVEKETVKGRTTTRVRAVAGDTRVEEVARLLDGSLTDVSVKHAAELLSKSVAK
ncbi:MAG TPA: DNA repair protein RecN [Candidatus Hydrogenedentes bacterium]|nr:DNA repair protein RecN [Candidatus Hydrogenedentota bacterium]